MVNNRLEFTGSEFFDILREFQDRVKEGSYKKTVPYDIWRELKTTQKPVSFNFVEDCQLGGIFFNEDRSYTEYFSEEGLIAFLYDKWVAITNNWLPDVKEEDDMTINDALKVAIDGTVSATEIKIEGGPILADKFDPAKLEPGTIMLNIDDNWAEKGKIREDFESLNTRIDEIVKNLTEKADVDSLRELFNYSIRDRADIDRLEAKTFENRNEINHLDDRLDELNGCISVLTSNYSKVNDALCSLRGELTDLEIELEEKENKKKVKNKENNTMKNFNFDFGPCTNDNVRMSMYGLAVKNAAGTYVSFNPATREIVDVDIFNFDGSKYMYKMPVATKDVAVGDVIIHQRKPMFVEGFTELGGVMAVDPVAGERKEIMLTKSPFGFNFVTKVVSLFNMCGNPTPTTEQPFGNMLPFMMMNEEGGDIDPMMLMFMMGQSGGANTSAFGNPMMMYFLMKDKDEIDPMMMFMMMNQQQPHTCQCENKCAQA